MQVEVGFTYLLTALILLPFYARIIFIFLTNRKYRDVFCYRIMIQIGLIQCSTAPVYALVGLAHLLNKDHFHLAAQGEALVAAELRVEAILSLVLALDRMKIICGLNFPQVVQTIIIVLSYVFGICFVVLLISPYAGCVVTPGKFLISYDAAKPYSYVVQKTGTAVIIGASLLTLIVYVIIIAYLIRRKMAFQTTEKISSHERTIFCYASVRFLFDVVLSVLYNSVQVQQNPLTDFCIIYGYILNNLMLSTVLYLTFYK
ncbi:hypothetical protein L596_013417 [Steinernema carpocapsae]|uniref:G-protein coupled receptors family 1 profile domain-containing protein n=1 Tax=Steinernema carpocapsae TaxID=34508 RepID=A0A4U5P0K7_STECR|nr:hypothetical protein L596_013417 [Steinernema carpocapsae]